MVSLSERDGSVTVRISDDGRGLDAGPASHGQPDRGFGLVSMAERAEAFGGQLRLESEPGGGTVVVRLAGRWTPRSIGYRGCETRNGGRR